MNIKSVKLIFSWLVFLGILFLNTEKGFSQNISDFMFENYLIKDGLSQSTPLSIFQDKLGYLWSGNQAGIDKFDGYTFKQYTHDRKNIYSHSAGWVRDITEDKDGNIWTVTNYGSFSKLDRTSDKWANFSYPVRDSMLKINANRNFSFGSARSIFLDSVNSLVWLATNGLGIISFNPSTKIFKEYLIHPDNPIKYGSHERSNFIEGVSANKLIVTTDIGLQYLDIKKGTFSKLFNIADSMFMVLPNDCKVVGEMLYVATRFGAFIYNTNTQEVRTFKHEEGNENTISSNNVFGIHYSKISNYLWMTIVGNGIDIFNLTNNKIIHLNKENAKDNGIVTANYTGLFEDKDNNIWIGSEISGLLKYDPGKRLFNLMNKNFPSDFNLGINASWGMTVGRKGIIWLGEYESGGGVLAIDRNMKTKKSYLKNVNGTTLRSWKLVEDNKESIYAFTGTSTNGLVLYVKPNNKDAFNKLGFVNDLLPNATSGLNSKDFLSYKKEVILAGPKPVLLADSNGKIILSYYPLPRGLEKGVYATQRKSQSELYVFNEDGIFLFNEINNTVNLLTKGLSFKGTDLYSIPSLCVINNKMAFISTYGNGLVKVDLVKKTKVFLTLTDGIPNLFLYDIYVGKNNILWISSNYGLIRYNPITNKFRSFGPAEGLQDYEFNSNSSFQSPSGEIFFNGVSGLNFFIPETIKEDNRPPNVVIQKFSTKDTSIYIESSSSLIPIEVNYKNNNLSFEFVAFNFRDARKNQYAYKMEGYDEDWIYVGSRRFTTYTNLREGKYIFRVKAANSDGVWNEEGASMVIKILPPIWRTWWAYILYFLLTTLFIYLFAKYREKKQIKKLEDERKNGELAEAKALQERLLPKHNPTIEHLDIATYLRTSTEVGGDYYDFFEQPDGSLYAICGDATGHGTPSGMLVSITKAGIIGLPAMSPNKMLSALNTVVKKVDLGILRMSLNIAFLKENKLTLSSAGMPPYFIYRANNNSTDEIMLSGIPLGSFNKVEYDEYTTEFNKGDILAIISDGLAEAPNAFGDLFDYTQIQSIINENSHMNAKTLISTLMHQADIWLAGVHNPDDITIIIIKHV